MDAERAEVESERPETRTQVPQQPSEGLGQREKEEKEDRGDVETRTGKGREQNRSDAAQSQKKKGHKRSFPRPLACAIYGKSTPSASDIQPLRREKQISRKLKGENDGRSNSKTAASQSKQNKKIAREEQATAKSDAMSTNRRGPRTEPVSPRKRNTPKSPGQPRFSDIDKFLKKPPVRPASARPAGRRHRSNKPRKGASRHDKQKHFKNVTKESKSYRSYLEHIVGKELIQDGYTSSSSIPDDLEVTVPIGRLVELGTLLRQIEAELSRAKERENERRQADEKSMRHISDQLDTVSKDIEESMAKHVHHNENDPDDPLPSVVQAELWLRQAKAIQSVVHGELGLPKGDQQVHNTNLRGLDAGVTSTSNNDEIVRENAAAQSQYKHLLLPNLASQAIAVSCGINQALSQACREGLESADSIIHHLFERDKEKAGAGALNQDPLN